MSALSCREGRLAIGADILARVWAGGGFALVGLNGELATYRRAPYRGQLLLDIGGSALARQDLLREVYQHKAAVGETLAALVPVDIT